MGVVDMGEEGMNTEQIPHLTNREKEVLVLCVGEAKSAKDAGEALQLSSRTVSYHLLNAYKKLGVHNALKAYLKCVKWGLIKGEGFTFSDL
jgi:DNA-binding CsgD family transcriptional regulator